jgi:hypothetical protein
MRELFGLFVEDGSFAVAIAVWLLITIFGLPHVFPSRWCGPIFFIGVVGLLIENLLRTARNVHADIEPGA